MVKTKTFKTVSSECSPAQIEDALYRLKEHESKIRLTNW